MDDDEWNVEETPPRTGVAGVIALSDSEPEFIRILRCREAEEDVEGEDMGFPDPDEPTCGIVGREKDDGDSDSADDSSMRSEWMKASESDESIRVLRGLVEMDGVSESSD